MSFLLPASPRRRAPSPQHFPVFRLKPQVEECGWLGKIGAAAIALGAMTSGEAKRNNEVGERQERDPIPLAHAYGQPDLQEISTMDDWNELKRKTTTEYYSKLVDANKGSYGLEIISNGVDKIVYKLPKDHPLNKALQESGYENISVLKLFKTMMPTGETDSSTYSKIQSFLRSRNAAPEEEKVYWPYLTENNIFPRVPYPNMKEEIENLMGAAADLMAMDKWQDSRSDVTVDYKGQITIMPRVHDYNSREFFEEVMDLWYSELPEPKIDINVWRATKKISYGIAAEFVTTIDEFRNAWELLGGSRFLWSQVFSEYIKENWENLEGDLIAAGGLIIDDNHSGNWGLRLKPDWKASVRDIPAPPAPNNPNPSIQDVELWRRTLSEPELVRLQQFSRLVRGATLANTDELYGSLVAVDYDKFLAAPEGASQDVTSYYRATSTKRFLPWMIPKMKLK